MSAEIHQLPGRLDREWQHVARQLHAASLQRTSSQEVADAVVARCRQIFEEVVPQPFGFEEAPAVDVMHTLHAIIGGFLCHLSVVIEENELMRGQQ